MSHSYSVGFEALSQHPLRWLGVRAAAYFAVSVVTAVAVFLGAALYARMTPPVERVAPPVEAPLKLQDHVPAVIPEPPVTTDDSVSNEALVAVLQGSSFAAGDDEIKALVGATILDTKGSPWGKLSDVATTASGQTFALVGISSEANSEAAYLAVPPANIRWVAAPPGISAVPPYVGIVDRVTSAASSARPLPPTEFHWNQEPAPDE